MVLTRHSRGFTIIEAMLTLLVVATLAALAAPAMTTFVRKDRSWSQANILVLTLNYARSEAVKRDLANGVSVCTTVDNLTCSGNPWQGGWIVRVNDPAGPVTLQTVNALNGGNVLTEANGITEVRFQSNGTVTLVGAPGVAAAQFKLCDATLDPQYARDIEVGLGGRIVSSTTPGKNVAGAALACP
jgi:type IV fimbrial biogenesis protein FimT